MAVAARMRTSQSAIARAERGTGPAPTLTFLERYAQAVGRPLAPLISPEGAVAPSREELQRLSGPITTLAAKLGFTRIEVVGSVARGDAHADSDVDFIVEAGPGLSGAGYFSGMDLLRQGIERITGRKVDIIDLQAAAAGRIRDKLLREARPL